MECCSYNRQTLEEYLKESGKKWTEASIPGGLIEYWKDETGLKIKTK